MQGIIARIAYKNIVAQAARKRVGTIPAGQQAVGQLAHKADERDIRGIRLRGHLAPLKFKRRQAGQVV
jgi:hypothetical protein